MGLNSATNPYSTSNTRLSALLNGGYDGGNKRLVVTDIVNMLSIVRTVNTPRAKILI